MIKKRKYMDNRGFSLVELLIAIVILAVIVAPLLHAFVTSTKINAKSKKELRETAAAQDIMEGLKAYKVEDLAYQFNYPSGGISDYPLKFGIIDPIIVEDGVTGLPSHVMELTDASGVFKNRDNAAASAFDTWSVKNYKPVDRDDMSLDHSYRPRTDGKYYYAIKNMSLADTADASNDYMKSSYVDVLIVADAAGFRDPAGAPSHADDKHNSKDLIDIPMMDSYIDAFYVEDSYTTTNNTAAQFFKNKYYATDMSITIEQIVKNMKKSMTIETKMTSGAARDKDGNPATRYEVNVKTEYKLRDGVGFKPETYKTNSTAFDNISTGEVLQNIYLFYQPIYHNLSDYPTLKDEVVYKATAGMNIDLYVIKQGSMSVTASDEQNYSCSIKVDGDANTVRSIRNNLDYNMVTNLEITPGNTSYDPTTISSKVKPLFGSDKEDRLYDCTVYLFEKGTIDDWLGGESYDLGTALTKIDGNMR